MSAAEVHNAGRDAAVGKGDMHRSLNGEFNAICQSRN